MNLFVLRVKQATHILSILLGSGFLAYTIFLMVMYETVDLEYTFWLKDEFIGWIIISSLLLFFIEFVMLGGFSKKSRNLRVLWPISVSILVTLLMLILQLMWTRGGLYALCFFNSLLLLYCGVVGSPFPQKTSKPLTKDFKTLEKALYPILTAVFFLISLRDMFEFGYIFPTVNLLLSLVILVILNYKQPLPFKRKLFQNRIFQFFMIYLILCFWFLFTSFSYMITYGMNNLNHVDWGLSLNEGNYFPIAIATIIFGNIFLWNNIMFQINRVRGSALQPNLSLAIPDNTSSQQTLQSDYNNNNHEENPLICPNCDTLLEQDAIRELKAKKAVFCALCGNRISFRDIFGDEKEVVLEEHQRLLDKITNLSPPKTNHSEE